MRYFFHVLGDRCTYRDDHGEILPTVAAAKVHANVLAGEIAQDDDWTGYSVLVEDESGREIARVPVSDGLRSTSIH